MGEKNNNNDKYEIPGGIMGGEGRVILAQKWEGYTYVWYPRFSILNNGICIQLRSNHELLASTCITSNQERKYYFNRIFCVHITRWSTVGPIYGHFGI